MSLKKVVAAIKSHKRFLITTHTNPEGDALGSELALYKLLKDLGKDATIVNDDNLPFGYDFLPAINKIKKFKKNLRTIKFDCCIIVDCSDLTRCGQIAKIDMRDKTLINIDHHISNKKFAHINWIEPDASSCTQMLYKLYKKFNLPLNRDIALPLYVGMVTDSGYFHYSNTTSLSHRVVADLLKYNLDVTQIYKNLYENIPFEDMKLLMRILPSIKRQAKGRIAWFQIRRSLLEGKKVSIDLTENLLSFARAIKETEVAVLFKENLGVKNEVRVNLRSQSPKIDVNEIARFLGGGGHKTASGATVKGNIDEVRKKVLAKIRDSLR